MTLRPHGSRRNDSPGGHIIADEARERPFISSRHTIAFRITASFAILSRYVCDEFLNFAQASGTHCTLVSSTPNSSSLKRRFRKGLPRASCMKLLIKYLDREVVSDREAEDAATMLPTAGIPATDDDAWGKVNDLCTAWEVTMRLVIAIAASGVLATAGWLA